MKIAARFFAMFMEGEDINNIKSMCFVDLANYFHDKGKIDNAITYYNKAVRLNPKNYYAFAGATAAFLEKRLFGQALESGNKAINIKKPDIQMNILMMIAYESMGKKELSKETMNKIVDYFGNMPAAYNALAHIYFKLRLFDYAERYCKEAMIFDGAQAGLHYNLALIYAEKNQLQMALIEYRKVLELKVEKKYERLARKGIVKIIKQHPQLKT